MAHELHKKAASQIKGEKCYICGKKCTSFCDSHSIPKFILKNIAESGHVYLPTATKNQDIEVLKKIYKSFPGINEAQLFKNICRDCDNKVFNSIENVDTTLKPFTNKEYSLYALKILLHDIYIKEYCCCLDSLNHLELTGHGSIHFDWLADIKDMAGNANYYIDALENHAYVNHNVVLDVVLEKKVNFACVTKLLLGQSYTGKPIYDLYDYGVPFGFVYVLVLPIDDNHTKISMFYRKKHKIYNVLKNEFDDMTLEDKLQAISNLIIMHTEDFTCTKRVIDKLRKIRKIVSEEVSEFSIEEYLQRIKKLNESKINLFNI